MGISGDFGGGGPPEMHDQDYHEDIPSFPPDLSFLFLPHVIIPLILLGVFICSVLRLFVGI
ncbi:hypothetical protein COY48_02005 [Candidatus Collierbacteria bacterium CG_4_10_14_0_8_um_filter_43_86]|uniref:Transmembrane protein n=1 Tax=Candidatus Collierbacteria bacterium CG_4_9_14_3_um_filter_43_16 TaxID=1974532 RepID=A0A2M8BT40_9BACT|nr:MAG: hypothetical protein COY48_02005 [Candidatus Collierbacteria bacterium CG_4_10_14_0_8_um_filter_43_86]PJB47034.1 MAG: hypothetical protein CO104_04775 [Candidatus Collierbacteria bacterium CG_4_9_14_3_um_filter_43_16]